MGQVNIYYDRPPFWCNLAPWPRHPLFPSGIRLAGGDERHLPHVVDPSSPGGLQNPLADWFSSRTKRWHFSIPCSAFREAASVLLAVSRSCGERETATKQSRRSLSTHLCAGERGPRKNGRRRQPPLPQQHEQARRDQVRRRPRVALASLRPQPTVQFRQRQRPASSSGQPAVSTSRGAHAAVLEPPPGRACGR